MKTIAAQARRALALLGGLALASPCAGPPPNVARITARGEPIARRTDPPNVDGQALSSTIPAPRASDDASGRVRPSGPCDEGMVLVDGDHCSEVVQRCLKWMDPPPYEGLRCERFREPSRCKGDRRHLRYCIDRFEATRPGEDKPIVNISFTEAKSACKARGARLCTESEWELACEGPEMLPYPHGFERRDRACNIDRTDLGRPEQGLTDHREPVGSFERCVSPFGVYDMTGNADEWAEIEHASPPNRSALRGGWWLPGRNRCRAATYGHTEDYGGPQVGYRCCKEPLAGGNGRGAHDATEGPEAPEERGTGRPSPDSARPGS